MLWLYCDCSDTSLWIFCWRKKTGAQQDGETNIFDGCTMQCTSNWSSGSCCQAPAAPLPPASPAPMTTPVFYLPSTFDFFTRRLQRLLSLAQCHATAKISNDETEKDTNEWLKFAERNMVQEEGCLDIDLLLLKGGCCQTSWRHGLTFKILQLTVCKKSVVKRDTMCFIVFFATLSVGYRPFSMLLFIGLQCAMSKISS